MNREELLKLVDSLNFKKTEFYVLSGGSLLIRKLRERTEDLDLCVSNELFKNIVDKYKIKEESKNAGGFYHILKEVEVIYRWISSSNTWKYFRIQEKIK